MRRRSCAITKKTIEYAKCQCWYSEEVHRCEGFTVVGQKCRPPPSGLGNSRRLPHPIQHGSFGNPEAEHLQLAMNPRRAPGGVLSNHSEDQFPQFLSRGSSSYAHPAPRNSLPVQLESGAMPTDNSFWLNNENRPLPARPEAAQKSPEELIGQRQAWTRPFSDHNRKLLSQGKIFEQKIAARTE